MLALATVKLRQLVVEHDMVIAIVNLVTTWINSNGVELSVPGLDKYWQSVPAVRLEIKKCCDSNRRNIRIMKSTITSTNVKIGRVSVV